MYALVLRDSITGNMTDEEFLKFCLENQSLRIERNSNLEIILMSPVTLKGGNQSGEVFRQLANWALVDGTGISFDSSSGFTLPDRSVLSPDASWIENKKWELVSEQDKDRFTPICPDFVIEVRSKSDSIDDLREKMKVWIKNGVQLAWLIDPRDHVTFVYRSEKEEQRIDGMNEKILGEGIVQGFALDLSLLKI
jgi:Uma2 family endonuclease